MDLSQIPLFAAMAKRLGWLSARQGVIAENVANANTPGFRAADLKPLSFGKLLGSAGGKLQLVATEAAHITSAGGTVRAAETPTKVVSADPVSLEDQMMKVSQNAADFAFTTSLYQKQIALLKEALGH